MITMQVTQRPVLFLELLSSCLMPHSSFIVEIPTDCRFCAKQQISDAQVHVVQSNVDDCDIFERSNVN